METATIYIYSCRTGEERRYIARMFQPHTARDIEALSLTSLGSYEVPLSKTTDVKVATENHRGREDSLARKIQEILAKDKAG